MSFAWAIPCTCVKSHWSYWETAHTKCIGKSGPWSFAFSFSHNVLFFQTNHLNQNGMKVVTLTLFQTYSYFSNLLILQNQESGVKVPQIIYNNSTCNMLGVVQYHVYPIQRMIIFFLVISQFGVSDFHSLLPKLNIVCQAFIQIGPLWGPRISGSWIFGLFLGHLPSTITARAILLI